MAPPVEPDITTQLALVVQSQGHIKEAIADLKKMLEKEITDTRTIHQALGMRVQTVEQIQHTHEGAIKGLRAMGGLVTVIAALIGAIVMLLKFQGKP